MFINQYTFRQWWDIFHSDNPLTEVRLLGTDSRGKKMTASGYFTDCETALKAIQEWPEELGVYSPFNQIKESCYGRTQRDRIIASPEATTSGNDIDGRRWILLDFDPKRSSGTNSTDAEKAEARKVMRKVGTFLKDQGFRSPVVADSSNGYHLLYRIRLANTGENTALIKNFLTVLDMFFSNEHVDIDGAVSDPNRIAKVYGTRTVKGADVPERPRRESKFVQVPDVIEMTDIAFIRKVVAMLPERETPSRFNGYRDSFDIERFITDHGIEVTKRASFHGGTKLILAQCPFDANHRAPDSAIFVMDNGAIGFKCLHASCSAYTWRDVRLHYDPDAYSQRDQYEYQKKRDFYSTAPRPAPVIVDESEEKGRKWRMLGEIEWQDPSKLTYIPTGFTEIDRKIGGLCLGDVSIISGIAGAGKTSIINCLTLSAIQHGYKVAVWSGELSPYRFKSWIEQNAAGANSVKRGAGETEYYYCPKDIADRIDNWTSDRLYLYNNNYGNKSGQIIDDVKNCIREKGTQLVVFDNKMAMSLDSFEGDKNEREAGLINELKDLALASNIHIILVCHPRKEQMNTLLRMESIAGNSDLYNAAANVFLCHRVGADFERRAKDFFGKSYVDDVVSKGYNEVIEVAKNRTHGIKDFIAGLYFEFKTRRFLNTIDEYVIYGWQDASEVSLPPPFPAEEPIQVFPPMPVNNQWYNQESRELEEWER